MQVLRGRSALVVALCLLAAAAWAQDAAGPRNLLANSGFRFSANGTTPDYWDLHHAAALRFRDLHDQYGYDDTQPGPVAGVRTLKIVNSERNFDHLYLLSARGEASLPPGEYTFSTYARAEGLDQVLDLAADLNRPDERTTVRLGTQWRRYTARFSVTDTAKTLSPYFRFPSRGTVWLAAPQLEPGVTATAYGPAVTDHGPEQRSAVQASLALDAMRQLGMAVHEAPQPSLRVLTQFDTYVPGTTARLRIQTGASVSARASVRCGRGGASNEPAAVVEFEVALQPQTTQDHDVSLAGLDTGDYTCVLQADGTRAETRFVIVTSAPLVVRTNRFRHSLEINGAGFHLRGIMIGGLVPPEWYVRDLAERGINTLVYAPALPEGRPADFHDIDSVLALADKHGLRVIVGPAVMGQKSAAWAASLERFDEVVRRYRDSTTVLGWFVVDEPQAWTLRAGDLVAIRDHVKTLDPHRLVFVNWGSDDVPQRVGVEPHGSLEASDLYSIDYYPFTNSRTNLETYALRTARALKTAALRGQPGHSWLQLYGYLDVVREPTGDELNFMAYVNLLYGSGYSFWQTKSNARPTWDRLARINREAEELSSLLLLEPTAAEVQAPMLVGDTLIALWRRAERGYVIAVHVGDKPESFSVDVRRAFGKQFSAARSLFDSAAVHLQGATLTDTLGRYGTRVYELN
jgi:hypothetical protein